MNQVKLPPTAGIQPSDGELSGRDCLAAYESTRYNLVGVSGRKRKIQEVNGVTEKPVIRGG